MQPEDAGTLTEKGVALIDVDRYEESLTYFDKALAIEPRHVNTLNNKGIALDDLGRYEEAINQYNKVLAIEPDSVGALYNKGVALDDLGRYRCQNYKRAVQLIETFPSKKKQLTAYITEKVL